MADDTVRITEIFYSLQGETSTIGLPVAFIRLTGCPLRCLYCDTEYAFHGGEKYTLEDILTRVASFNTTYVTVTGGEPLAQPLCLPLLTQLCDAGYRVSLETSGALPIKGVDPRVAVILDIKTPGSGEVGRNLWENIAELNDRAEIKFVLCGRQDYEWARLQLDQHKLCERDIEVLFSPSHSQLNATNLADWILEDNLPVRMQLQLHKQLWGDEPGK
ncbi:MAG: 7-carboxy-7-deazaguanine synthase QueE [Gammaproteobacteria bacterium]|nr:MAG: 7-carboxy-7-deazaguanine synthase QueE [Gammaproteobacteria bacterium]RLA54051.1 MAG: 7-carboxy-7-deazaguanine synthase QueE [Gammaproteobacteria bacterium]